MHRSPSPHTDYNKYLNPADLSGYGPRYGGYSPSERKSTYDNNSRRGSPVRSRLYMDAQERAEIEVQARDEYEHVVDELRHTEGITEEDVKDFQKSVIIRKSVDVVRILAENQAEIRKRAANNYRDVKSKVARCIKVRNKAAKQSKKQRQNNFGISQGSERSRDGSFQSSSMMKTFENGSINIQNQSSPFRQSPRLHDHQDQINKINEEIKAKQLEQERIQQQINQTNVDFSKSQGPLKASDLVIQERPSSQQARRQKEEDEMNAKALALTQTQPKTETQKMEPTVIQVKKKEEQQQQSKNKVAVDSQIERTGSVEFVERRSDYHKPTTKIVSKKVNPSQEGLPVSFTKTNKKIGQNSGLQGPVIQNQQQTQPQVQVQTQVQAQVQPTNIQIQTSTQVKDLPKQQEEPADDYQESFGQLAQKTKSEIQNQDEESNRFLNRELEDKTTAIQEEFDTLLESLMNNRNQRDPEEFYKIMNEFYGKGPDDLKHDSPTKRLISHKNSTTDHKKVMASNIQRGEYSQTYCVSPGKSYIIEPHGGELNYNLAHKDPLKFYDQVLNQDITKHKFKQDESSPSRRPKVEISSKVTKRPLQLIIEKIRFKIEEQLRQRIGNQYGLTITQALKDQGIEQTLKIMMAEDKIQLVNQKNEPVYQAQIYQAAQESHIEADVEIEAVSPDTKSAKTRLSMKQQDLEKVESEVRSFIRRNSKFPVDV